jgi:predicted dehydrogenase
MRCGRWCNQKGLEALKDAPRKPVVVKDIRALVKQKDFDALLIAAPDHWHTPAAILGVQKW